MKYPLTKIDLFRYACIYCIPLKRLKERYISHRESSKSTLFERRMVAARRFMTSTFPYMPHVSELFDSRFNSDGSYRRTNSRFERSLTCRTHHLSDKSMLEIQCMLEGLLSFFNFDMCIPEDLCIDTSSPGPGGLTGPMMAEPGGTGVSPAIASATHAIIQASGATGALERMTVSQQQSSGPARDGAVCDDGSPQAAGSSSTLSVSMLGENQMVASISNPVPMHPSSLISLNRYTLGVATRLLLESLDLKFHAVVNGCMDYRAVTEFTLLYPLVRWFVLMLCNFLRRSFGRVKEPHRIPLRQMSQQEQQENVFEDDETLPVRSAHREPEPEPESVSVPEGSGVDNMGMGLRITQGMNLCLSPMGDLIDGDETPPAPCPPPDETATQDHVQQLIANDLGLGMPTPISIQGQTPMSLLEMMPIPPAMAGAHSPPHMAGEREPSSAGEHMEGDKDDMAGAQDGHQVLDMEIMMPNPKRLPGELLNISGSVLNGIFRKDE